jgi:putative ABC transport system permease protein
MPDFKPAIRERLRDAKLTPTREMEIIDEFEQHLADRYNEILAERATEAEAYKGALAELDEADFTRELQRAEWLYAEPVAPGTEHGTILSSVWQDVRYAARTLRNTPGFAVVAVLSLALGIGANTAIFQLLDSVQLRSLPVKDPQELALVRIADRSWSNGQFRGRYSHLTNPQWEAIRNQQQAFSSIAAFGFNSFDLSSGGPVRIAHAMLVSGDLFNVLQVTPIAGRVFTANDDRRGCASIPAVISYGFWQHEFGGKNAIGSTLHLDGHVAEVVGVTPPNFYGVEVGRTFDVAVPICSEKILAGEDSVLDRRHAWWLAAMGRLKPGWTLEKATAQLQAISPGVFQSTVPPVYDVDGIKHYTAYKLAAFPGGNGVSSLRLDYEQPLWLLLGIAGLVLLIACANLANLMLARATSREREVAVRLALGASRKRLVRQFLTESVLLAIGGAVIGFLLAQTLSRFLVRLLATTRTSPVLDMGVDWRMLTFTTALALLTCMVFGLAPALRATRSSPAALINANGRGMTASRERFGMRRILVVAQVSLSLVLVVSALLFVRSLHHLLTDDGGFQESGVLITDVDLTRLKLPVERRSPFKDQLLRNIRAVPGVEFAAEANIAPLSGSSWKNLIEGWEGKGIEGSVSLNRVTPSFLAVMGTPLLAGRDFNEQDTAPSPPVLIVNEAFAKKYFPQQSPIGKTVKMSADVGEARPLYEIVGIMKNSKYSDVHDDFAPLAYVVYSQESKPDQYTELMVRSNLPLETLTDAIKKTVAETNPEIAIDFHVLKTQIRDGLVRERMLAALSGFFGLLAALLATVGLYGMISYMVARRTNEIGIRMALGARRGDIVKIILREAGLLLGSGSLIGAALALAAGRAASTLLYGLKPHDPLTLGASILALVMVGTIASVLPAARAARLDPMVALRVE